MGTATMSRTRSGRTFSTSDTVYQLCKVANIEYCRPNQIIFRQGDSGSKWYVLLRGKVDIQVSPVGAPTARVTVACLSQGQGFGELALVNNNPRAATVVCCAVPTRQDKQRPVPDDLIFLTVDKMDYLRIARTIHQQELQAKIILLSQIPTLAALTPAEPSTGALSALQSMAAVLRWRTCGTGEVLLKHGQPAGEFFFIRRGFVDVYRPCGVIRGKVKVVQVKVARKGPGDYFGEEWVCKWGVSDYLSRWAKVKMEDPKTVRARFENLVLGNFNNSGGSVAATAFCGGTITA
ncbi:hypothetical protein BCR44DRAFT_142305, partial [Catenaria anguillulae PL171]